MFGLGKKLTFIIAVAAAVTVSALVGHYVLTVKKVATLQADNAKLSLAVDLQEDTISAQQDTLQAWEDEREEFMRTLRESNEIQRAAADQTRRLYAIFAEHDLTEIANSRPGLLEDRVNDASADMLRLLACATRGGGEDCRGGGPDSPDGSGTNTTTETPGATTR